MKRNLLSFLISSALVLLMISTAAFSYVIGITITSKEGNSLYLYEDYHALVIGISNYEHWPKLPYAVEDAKEIGAKLNQLGFKVTLAMDPNAREMRTLLNELVYDMGRDRNRALLLFYAGHGETETLADNTKMGYIIPRDCPLLKKDAKNFSSHAISMRDIESVSLKIKAKHVLMIFDSCFSGSIFNLVRTPPQDISEKSTLPVRQYITAGREDEQVPDKSIFKRCLMIGLDGDADLTGDGYITGSELGMYLSDKVVNYTHRRQHPQYGKINNPELDRGDFLFVVSRKGKTEEEKSHKDKAAITEELKRLSEEREKSIALLNEIKKLLEEKKRAEKDTNSHPKTTDEREGKLDVEGIVSEDRPGKVVAEREGKPPNIKEKQIERDKNMTLAHAPRDAKGGKELLSQDQSKWKLAILPSKFDDRTAFGKTESVLNDALKEVFKGKDMPTSLLSYYQFNLEGIEIIGEDIIDQSTLDNLWAGSFLSKTKPEVQVCTSLGEKLKVDAALLYSIKTQTGTDFIDVFLIDIHSKKMFEARGTTEGFFDWGEGLPALIRLTKIVISDYEREKSKDRN